MMYDSSVLSANLSDTVSLANKLTGALIGLARATEGNDHLLTPSTADVVIAGLCATAVSDGGNEELLVHLLGQADAQKRMLVPDCYNCAASCGRTNDYDMQRLAYAEAPVRDLKQQILSCIRAIALHAHRAARLGIRDESVHYYLYRALFSIGMEDWGPEELVPIVQEAEAINRRCLELVEQAEATSPVAPRE